MERAKAGTRRALGPVKQDRESRINPHRHVGDLCWARTPRKLLHGRRTTFYPEVLMDTGVRMQKKEAGTQLTAA